MASVTDLEEWGDEGAPWNEPNPPIYVQFSDDGRHIRKWQFEPFEGGRCYLARYEPTWENPDGPQAA